MSEVADAIILTVLLYGGLSAVTTMRIWVDERGEQSLRWRAAEAARWPVDLVRFVITGRRRRRVRRQTKR